MAVYEMLVPRNESNIELMIDVLRAASKKQTSLTIEMIPDIWGYDPNGDGYLLRLTAPSVDKTKISKLVGQILRQAEL